MNSRLHMERGGCLKQRPADNQPHRNSPGFSFMKEEEMRGASMDIQTISSEGKVE